VLCAKMGTCFPWCNSRVHLRFAFEMSCWSRLRVSVNASVFAWIAEDYLRTLITTAKNGGHKGLKDAVEYRLRALRARDRGGLFEWVDADSSAAGGHGHFVILLRQDAVDVIRQHGTEIFIDRWDTKVTNPPSLSRVTDRNHVLLTACSWFWCLHSTHCTTRRVKGHQDLQLYNILVRDRGGHGVVVASFYLERHDANTVSAALEHIVRWLYEKHRVVWDVNMSMQDDSAVERAAVSKVWPRAQIRLCVWHIAHRNVQAKLTGYFSLSFALVVVKVVWDLVRRGGHRACKAPVEILCDAVDFFAAKLAGLGMMPAIHEGNKYHPQEVKRRLRTGESAPCQPPPPLHSACESPVGWLHAQLNVDVYCSLLHAGEAFVPDEDDEEDDNPQDGPDAPEAGAGSSAGARPKRRRSSKSKGEPKKSPAEEQHLRGWKYLVRTLFKDLARAKMLYPFLNPNRTDNVDVNNLVEVCGNSLCCSLLPHDYARHSHWNVCGYVMLATQAFHSVLKHWSDRYCAAMFHVPSASVDHCLLTFFHLMAASRRWAGGRHGSKRLSLPEAVECVYNAHVMNHDKYRARCVRACVFRL
jgi:hypothetical protein